MFSDLGVLCMSRPFSILFANGNFVVLWWEYINNMQFRETFFTCVTYNLTCNLPHIFCTLSLVVVVFCRKRQGLRGKLSPLHLSPYCASFLLLAHDLYFIILSRSNICLLLLSVFPSTILSLFNINICANNVLNCFFFSSLLSSVLFISRLSSSAL